MAASNACWGVELGSGGIKAIKLVREGDGVRVADFIVLPHKMVLSTPGLDLDGAMRVAVGALTSQYDLSKARIAISAAGHDAFVRFAKLPPVEPKKVASIVKFEAAQQIPFPLEEVEWDYQTFAREDSPDLEVGIFAMTRDRVMQRLDLCRDANLKPDILTLSPIAAFNAMAYDLPIGEDTPGVAIIDIGTTATDLIIADQGRVWVRTFPLGGHSFTEAIVEAFKLPYAKAEKLKREAEQSKHKRHIFQAMRPVFTDLAQEVQRSMAFYAQLHPEAEITRVIGLGSTFRLIGLRKYLSQQIHVDVTRCGRFHRLAVEGPADADFQSATLTMATAYGLALQGLGLAAIDANLVPTTVVRESLWKRKRPLFVAAAVLSIAAGGVSFLGPLLDAQRIEKARSNPDLRQVQQVESLGRKLRSQWQDVSKNAQIGFAAENTLRLFERRDLYAELIADVASMIATAPPDEPGGFTLKSVRFDYKTPSGGAPTWIKAAGGDQNRPRARRGRSGGASGLGGGGAGRAGQNRGAREGQRAAVVSGQFGSFVVTLVVESDDPDLSAHVDRTLLAWLRKNAERDSASYTMEAPNPDEVSIEEVGGRSSAGPRADGATRSSTKPGAAQREATPTDLAGLAPLTTPPAPSASGAKAYRYVITFRVFLKPPRQIVNLGSDDRQAQAGEVIR